MQTANSIRARHAGLLTSWRSLFPSESPCQSCGTQALRRILLRRTNCSCNCMLRPQKRRAMASWVAVKRAATTRYLESNLPFYMGNYLLGSRKLCSCGTDPRRLSNPRLSATRRASLPLQAATIYACASGHVCSIWNTVTHTTCECAPSCHDSGS